MKFGDMSGDSSLRSSQQDAAICQSGDVLKYVSVLDGLGRVLAPGEWGMTGHQHSGNSNRIEFC